MQARDLLKQFDDEFDLHSVSNLSTSQNIEQNPQTDEKSEINSQIPETNQQNASFSGLNDSSHFDMSSFNQDHQNSINLPTGSPGFPTKPIPTLDDIPNSSKYLDSKVNSPINPSNTKDNSESQISPANSDPQLKPINKSVPKQFSVPSFSFSSMTQSQISNSQSTRSNLPTDTKNILKTIEELKKERVKDTEKIKKLLVENARLQARLTILEHTDVKVAELGSKVEQLLQDYIDNEEIRAQQASLITQLRQEVIILKSRISAGIPQVQPQQSKPRVKFD
ncbi:hypothetical protein TVAG_436390 [Trichomonas vaginalis G3]|uniref:Uncharacterized protein n=1 Tax=Trichomonas vaginalis (strain ATCC PRA-98 / G3) TaxID=412133 RepID=A2DF87_TRIV3|nr:hypothetical protein TVAGG3_0565900 [Trichomonas vaginalis G3]EAY20815.1 hypothetical protein TVAG_436390 [Trichomonas vaginalis G3]KAI5521577.1 hypothetical protein TVAGG3_0565900 [Trichomonas vaginalis G3]|eukprot:XP_001581801.1 hypothetical protein [Trichomonas vaginalis G3]